MNEFISLSVSLSLCECEHLVIFSTSNVCYLTCFMTAIQPGAPVGIYIQSIHFVSNNTYPCLLYKVMKTCDVLSFCKSILCYFIHSSAKQIFLR